MKLINKKIISRFMVTILSLGFILAGIPADKSYAAVNYPAQAVKFTACDGKNLNIKGYADNSQLNTWEDNGAKNDNWYIQYVSDGVYKIVNQNTNKLISAENYRASAGAKSVILPDNNNGTQQWNITGVEKDYLGNYLYYKITNNQNKNLALTYDSNSNSITLQNYTGGTNQKWKLNCDGLEGFAGNCNTSNGEKAGTIGGLLGKTVFVNDLSSLKNALLDDKPLTVVIASNIDNCNSEMYDLRIASNKTIIGSYGANRLTDPRLRTDDYFKKEKVSNNIILRNLDMEVKEREDVVAFAVYGSDNIWVDHCTFNCSLKLYYDEVGKFIWVNRSEYAGDDPDFVTLSYNKFNHRFWGIAFGAGGTTQDRATVMYNYFDTIVQRTPHLGNGSLHVYNNFHKRSQATLYNDGYAAIKGGDGAQIYSESNRFEDFQKESSGYWDNEFEVSDKSTCTDIGTYTNRGEKPVSVPYKISLNYKKSSWNPSSNYGYSVIKAYGSNDTKDFCTKYSGAVSSLSNLKYINYSECSKYVDRKVQSPIKKTNPSSGSGDTGNNEEVLDNNGIYMIKNAHTNMYMEVAGGKAENAANVQQWGANGPQQHNTWKAVYAGNGYYQLYSQVGDGKTYLLDLYYGNKNNGTNIGIYQNTYCDAQLFKIQPNSDGTYSIFTKVSGNNSSVEVANASTNSGANIQQWANNDGAWQHWIFEKVK